MPRIISILIIALFLIGCENKEIKTTIKEDKHISINYPVTNINALDNEISSFVNKKYNEFKKNYKYYKYPELNISYTYKQINGNIINISLIVETKTNKTNNLIKTYTFDKKTKKFLTLENIIQDLDVLDFDIKKALLEKYKDIDIEFLNKVSYENFSVDDQNLTIYFNPIELKNNRETIYLDIPLNSLKLLIDIDKSKENDTYINLKQRNVDYDDKVVALTFDDGPSKYTEEIINILKKHDACGTFFVIGNKVDFYDEILIKMIKNGNEIGNHSYSHKWLNRLSEKEFKEEIDKTQKEVKKSTGFTPKLFRPTYGGYTNKLRSYTDLTFVLWDVDSRDWQVKDKNKIYNNVIPNVKSGSIILFHDNHKFTADSIEKIIIKLKEEGYQFVTVSELLKIKEILEE